MKSFFLLIPLWLFACVCFGGQVPFQVSETVGQIFGEPIPAGNYQFVLNVVITFGTPWGGVPADQEQLKKRIEDDLLLSYESFRRNILVSREEIDPEITNTLKDNKVDFDWQTDKEAYAKWVKDTLGEPVEFFENQMKHLVQLKKLQRQVLDSIKPDVTEQEAFQEFLNEYNTLSIELVQFDDLKEAEKFYQQSRKDLNFWDKEKEKNPDRFKRPGFVALEFLMYMWQLPKKAVYDMIEIKIGSVYPPTPIYRGHGVFKVLEIRQAQPSDFPRLKESYYEQIRQQKEYDGFNKWLKDLHKESNMKIDINPPEELFQDRKTQKIPSNVVR